MKIKKDITVAAPVDVVYAAWHNFENFPRFMENVEEVRVVSGGRSHWKAKGPLGYSAEWDAEMTLDDKERAIGWRAVPGDSSVMTGGRVNFEDMGDRRTKLDVTIEYAPPAGPLGEAVAKIFSDPEKRVGDDLERFREVMESGAEFSAMGQTGGQGYGSSMGATNEEQLREIERRDQA